MKIIDLLNKIANGEEVPKKILYDNLIFKFNPKDGTYENCDSDLSEFMVFDIGSLNDEVEILETTITYKPDKIEKLEITREKNCNNNWKWKLNGYNISTPQKIMGDKINEIIEKVNKL